MHLSLETLTSIIGTDLAILGELIDLVNSVLFFILNDLTQIVNFPTQTPDCDSHGPTLLDLFISSHASKCSTMDLPPMGNSDVVVSVSIDFPSYSQQDSPFQSIIYDCSHAD